MRSASAATGTGPHVAPRLEHAAEEVYADLKELIRRKPAARSEG